MIDSFCESTFFRQIQPISVQVTTAGNGARFCATSAPKIGPIKCFILTLRWLSVVHREIAEYQIPSRLRIRELIC